MAKKQIEAKTTETFEPEVPKGYNEVAEDIVGYWDPSVFKLIHVIPKEAKIFDNKIEPSRVSILIFCKLVDSAILVNKDEYGEDIKVEGKPGDTIGIWGKPGLRQKIMNMAGKDCYICQNAEKDIGRPQPMKLYSVKAKGMGERLPLTEDRRKQSKNQSTWWHNDDGSSNTPQDDDNLDDIGF